MSRKPLLRLTNASFGYGRTTVLSAVNLTVEEGEFVGFVGPNGGGKSTLLRGAIGLLSPLEGRVEPFTHRVGYVPQRDTLDALYPWTVLEVVEQGASARLKSSGTLSASDREEAQACLARVDLSEKKRALFSSLSGGQRQRALLARALLMRPELIALDEPTSGVDAAAKDKIFELLQELRSDGLTVLLVSHDLRKIESEASRVLRIGEGRVIDSCDYAGEAT